MTSPDKSKRIYCPRTEANCPHRVSAKKICFVIMAYTELYSSDIEKMLKRAVINVLKLKPILAKDSKKFGSTQLFCTKVCKHIIESTCCMVDVTYNNTNVGIEIATAHGFDKPIIITQYIPNKKNKEIKKDERKMLERLRKTDLLQYSVLPLDMVSDLSGIFYIRYKDQSDLIKQLKEKMDVKS